MVYADLKKQNNMKKFDTIAENLAIKDIAQLETQGVKYLRQTPSGSYTGHYSENEYFFIQVGKEAFRTNKKDQAIKWLAKIYKGA